MPLRYMYAVIQLSRDPTAGRSKSIRHEYLRSHKRSQGQFTIPFQFKIFNRINQRPDFNYTPLIDWR